MRRCGAASGGLRRRHGPGASAPESNTRSATRRDDPVAQAVWWRTHLDVARLRLLAASGLGAVRWVMYGPASEVPRDGPRAGWAAPSGSVRRGARACSTASARAWHGTPTPPTRTPGASSSAASARLPGSLLTAEPGRVASFLFGDVATHLQQVLPATDHAATLSNVLTAPARHRDCLLRAAPSAAPSAVRPGGVLILRSMRQPPLHLPPGSQIAPPRTARCSGTRCSFSTSS